MTGESSGLGRSILQPELNVYYRQSRVGALIVAHLRVGFAYDEAWLNAADAFPISQSLPLRSEPFDAASPAHDFFANLLPEGAVRSRLCQRLKLSEDNDIALLRAIGGDCAGALSIAESPPPDDADHYELITSERLVGWARGEPTALDDVSGRGRVRLSLAGAQDKLPVRADHDGLWLPLDGAPSTHLLKFEAPDFRHLPANEALTTAFARALGLPVVELSLLAHEAPPLALVRRYDRAFDDDGQTVTRVHQEDCCQALGLPAARKYQHEGGPSLAAVAELARRASATPATTLELLIRWAAFNLVAGNADAHGKNLSWLFTPGQGDVVTLAPFYDLVCTRAYERLDANFAMGIGGEHRPGEIAGKHWRGLASALNLPPRLVVELAADIVERAPRALEQASAEHVARYGDSPAVERVRHVVRKQQRRSAQLLAR